MPIQETFKSFPPAPEGLHEIRLIWIIDLGSHVDVYEGKESLHRKLLLGYELVNTVIDQEEKPEPYVLSQKFNLSTSKFGESFPYYAAETSNLFKLGKGFLKLDSKAAKRIGSYVKKIGAAGQVLVTHKEYKTNDGQDRTFAQIDTVKPLPASKEAQVKAAVNDQINFLVGDDIPESMPTWVKKMVLNSKEGKAFYSEEVRAKILGDSASKAESSSAQPGEKKSEEASADNFDQDCPF